MITSIACWKTQLWSDQRRARIMSAGAIVMSCVMVALSVAACSTGVAPSATPTLKALTPIEIVDPGLSVDFAYINVAQRAGIFAKNGLNVRIVTLTGSAINGSVVAGSAQATPVIGGAEVAHLEGLPIVPVMAADTNASITLEVVSSIHTLSDLRGKTVIGGPASAVQQVSLNKVLATHGMTGQVTTPNVGVISAIKAAYVSGHAAGVMNSANVALSAGAEVPGSHVLIPPSQNETFGDGTGLAVSEAFLKSHPATVEALERSVLEALKLMITDPKRTEQIYSSVFGLNAKLAAQVYNLTRAQWILQPAPSTAYLQAAASFNSTTLKKPVTLQQEKEAWSTSLASKVFKQLDCPKRCAA